MKFLGRKYVLNLMDSVINKQFTGIGEIDGDFNMKLLCYSLIKYFNINWLYEIF